MSSNSSIIHRHISNCSTSKLQLLFRYLLKIIIPIMLLKSTSSLLSPSSSLSMALNSHRFNILRLQTHLLNMLLSLRPHIKVVRHHHNNGKAHHITRKLHSTVEGADVVVADMLKVVVVLKPL